jgi:hypothetical protein
MKKTPKPCPDRRAPSLRIKALTRPSSTASALRPRTFQNWLSKASSSCCSTERCCVFSLSRGGSLCFAISGRLAGSRPTFSSTAHLASARPTGLGGRAGFYVEVCPGAYPRRQPSLSGLGQDMALTCALPDVRNGAWTGRSRTRRVGQQLTLKLATTLGHCSKHREYRGASTLTLLNRAPGLLPYYCGIVAFRSSG